MTINSVYQCDVYDPSTWPSTNHLCPTLAVADPPYGDIVPEYWDKADDDWLASRNKDLATILQFRMPTGSSFYLWGGFGTPGNRSFYKSILQIEDRTHWKLSSHVTWKKKRAYGIQWGYMRTREELAHFVLGDIKKPLVFNTPYTEELRGYAGYNAKYPAKSPYKRAGAVWADISETFRNKPHVCHKPSKICNRIIETSSNSGDVVLDLFSGSGELALSCQELGRHSLSFEQDHELVNKIQERLSS